MAEKEKPWGKDGCIEITLENVSDYKLDFTEGESPNNFTTGFGPGHYIIMRCETENAKNRWIQIINKLKALGTEKEYDLLRLEWFRRFILEEND